MPCWSFGRILQSLRPETARASRVPENRAEDEAHDEGAREVDDDADGVPPQAERESPQIEPELDTVKVS